MAIDKNVKNGYIDTGYNQKISFYADCLKYYTTYQTKKKLGSAERNDEKPYLLLVLNQKMMKYSLEQFKMKICSTMYDNSCLFTTRTIFNYFASNKA